MAVHTQKGKKEKGKKMKVTYKLVPMAIKNKTIERSMPSCMQVSVGVCMGVAWAVFMLALGLVVYWRG